MQNVLFVNRSFIIPYLLGLAVVDMSHVHNGLGQCKIRHKGQFLEVKLIYEKGFGIHLMV